jgi:hypothetical protein
MSHINRRYTAFFIWSAAALCASLMSCGPRDDAPTQKSQPKGGGGEQTVSIAVAGGDKTSAERYYAETFAALGLAHDIAGGEPRMSVMLAYLGYPDLNPSGLENTPSADLMKGTGEDLLASAFFAPKITDVSVKGPGDINVGWRKVIRLRARPGSDAAGHGIAAGFLLFNKFQGKDHGLDPFKPRDGDKSNESKTTQLILVRAEKGTGADPAQRPMHFFVFGPVSDGAKLKLALQASFDAAAHEVEAELAKKNPIKDYFVPVACGQCHGGIKQNVETGDDDVLFDRQKLNFLDTDHWFDRVQDSDDFAFIRTDNKFGVLFDGGTGEASAQFAQAFGVLRALNGEIRAQNERVELDPSNPSFQFRAVSKWLELHPAGDGAHKDVFARALPPLVGAVPVWNAAAEPDKTLLPLMNRFCYRCHSSIAYNLFDRNEVACRKSKIRSRLNLAPGSAGVMPQDRALDAAVKATLLELAAKLPDVKCIQ